MMKKIAILLVSAALLPLVSCKKDTYTPPPTPAGVPVTGVELDITEIGLVVGETAVLTATVLPENATDKAVTWSSSDPEIASVDENGTIEALAKGDAVITVTTTEGGKTSECAVTVEQAINGYEYVDLGLSVKWAAYNIGAEKPWDYGDYFAWGETYTKEEYNETNCSTYGVELGDISGDPEYDAAAAIWGGTWRLPTRAETHELLNECTWTLTSNGWNIGYEVTGPNGNSILLPAAGWRLGSSLNSDGGLGMYWDSTPLENDPSSSSGLNFYNSGHLVVWSYRYYGRSVRPVSE